MLLIYLILLKHLRFVTSESIMMIVFGVPNSLEGAVLNSTLKWDQCVQSCYTSQTCVMAWRFQSSCSIYNYSSMGTVTQTDSTNGSVIAFKVDNIDGICPDGLNPPTFDNQNATGSLYISSGSYRKWVYYKIYTSGNIWSLTYIVNNSCPSTSPIYYERSEGASLCVTGRIDGQESAIGGYNYDNLVSYCNEASTTPISFWYQEDTLYFSDLIKSWRPLLFQQARLNNTYIRIDGIRTSECQSTPKTDECMSVKGFTFVGPPPENLDSYSWVTDSSAQETLEDNCIVMVMNDTNPIKMDIRTCSGSGSHLPPKMIVCSTPAWGS